MEFAIKYKTQEHRFSFSPDAELREVVERLEVLTQTDPTTQKLLGSGIKGVLKLAEHGSLTLEQAGIQSGKRYTLLASSKEDVMNIQSAKELPRMRGIEEEERIEARRRRLNPTTYKPPDVEYGFGRYEVLRGKDWPSPDTAMQLLYRLANDVGIIGIMKRHKWRVGLLSEMPPEGKVGISARCILGYNVNKGQEISLRLRTDDKRGFRKYETIRETLIHELTHMVWSDHDDNFKRLNSELLAECERFQNRDRGRMLIDIPTASLEDESDGNNDGRRLGGQAVNRNPADAAREAALRRARDRA